MVNSPQKIVLLVLGGFLVGILITLMLMREPTEALTAANLQMAREHWNTAGIKNYDMAYQMHGNRYEIQVREGIVADVRVNGLSPTSTDWKAYNVEGLLNILGMDLETFRASSNQSNGSTVMMRVRFHPQLGYIERYVRSGSTATDATIQLLSFKQMGSTGKKKT